MCNIYSATSYQLISDQPLENSTAVCKRSNLFSSTIHGYDGFEADLSLLVYAISISLWIIMELLTHCDLWFVESEF